MLVPCTSCYRHVDSSASHCPFCDAALPAEHAARAPLAPRSHLSRARQLAAAAAVAVPLGACAGSSGSGDGNLAQPYGAPPTPVPTESAGGNGAPPDGGPTGNIAQPYGAPPTPQPSATAAPPSTAPVPAYGGPPVPR